MLFRGATQALPSLLAQSQLLPFVRGILRVTQHPVKDGPRGGPVPTINDREGQLLHSPAPVLTEIVGTPALCMASFSAGTSVRWISCHAANCVVSR